MKLPFQALRQAFATAQFPDADIQNEATSLLHDLSALYDGVLNLDDVIPEDVEDTLNDRARELLKVIHTALLEDKEVEESIVEVIKDDGIDDTDKDITDDNDDADEDDD